MTHRDSRHSLDLFGPTADDVPPPPSSPGSGPTVDELLGAASALSSTERRAWHIAVGLTALYATPLVIDALAVLALQVGPRPGFAPSGISYVVPELHVVLPFVPLVIGAAAMVVTPLALLVLATRRARHLVSRWSWLIAACTLGPPMLVSLGGAALDHEAFNLHLWGYSLGLAGVQDFASGRCDADCSLFFFLTVIALCGRVLRGVPLLFGALALRRVAGRGMLARAMGWVLVVQLVVWVSASFSSDPAIWRAVVDLLVGVALVFGAVLTQSAFEGRQRS